MNGAALTPGGALALVVGVALTLAGCKSDSAVERPTPVETASAAALPGRVAYSQIDKAPVPKPESARVLLAALPSTPRLTPSEAKYLRTAFGTPWTDIDGNGCNQRDDVLLRDGVPGTVRVVDQGRCDHDVVAGTWVDPYTDRVIKSTNLKDQREAQRVQIDHIIPLAEAWVSGANLWTEEQRWAFADDLAGLLAVDGPTNASKGEGDPAAWRPKKSFQCEYAARWISVKHDHGLAVDDSERRALLEMLDFC